MNKVENIAAVSFYELLCLQNINTYLSKLNWCNFMQLLCNLFFWARHQIASSNNSENWKQMWKWLSSRVFRIVLLFSNVYIGLIISINQINNFERDKKPMILFWIDIMHKYTGISMFNTFLDCMFYMTILNMCLTTNYRLRRRKNINFFRTEAIHTL